MPRSPQLPDVSSQEWKASSLPWTEHKAINLQDILGVAFVCATLLSGWDGFQVLLVRLYLMNQLGNCLI